MKIIGHDAVFACGLVRDGGCYLLYTDGKVLISSNGIDWKWRTVYSKGLEGLCQVQVVKGDEKWLAYGWQPDGSGSPYRPGIRYMEFESRNGLEWKPTGKIAVTMDKVGDSVTMYWEERYPWKVGGGYDEIKDDMTYDHSEKQLFLYAQAWEAVERPYQITYDNLPDKRRIIQRWRRDKWGFWHYDKIIFRPNDSDPWDLQFYYFSTYGDVGFLGLYHCAAQTTDIEICERTDGHWRRTGIVVDALPYVNLYTANTVMEFLDRKIMLMQMSLDYHNYEIPPGKRWDLGAWEYRDEWPDKIRPME